jgi:hypothetical protein
MNNLHWKTKTYLDKALTTGICGSGGDTIGFSFEIYKSKNGKLIDKANIPMEAQEFLYMATSLIHKANNLIEKQDAEGIGIKI